MLDDTIVAIATAPGLGAVAMLRLSGADAFAIASRIAPAFDAAQPRSARLLTLRDLAGNLIDHALVTAFPAPHSYTGEATVEFSTHGGALPPALLLAACLEAGARQAMPGEFTRRAVINGKLDLLQAEAVGDLIVASAPAQARQALRQLDGGLSLRIAALREALLHSEAMLAYAIDFPEEDDGPIDPAKIVAAVNEIIRRLTTLLDTASEGERVRRGALVVLAGPPNAGKSSLFNALLGRDRAMVTEIAGTTRDAIEADTSIDGWPVRLVDTAGLRDSDDRLELLGIEVSHRYLGEADLVVYCRTIEDAQREVHFGDVPFIEVITKADLPGAPHDGHLQVSVVSGAGLAALRSLMVARLFTGVRQSRGDEAMLTSVRQRLAVSGAREEAEQALSELRRDEPVLAAHRLRSAVNELDELIGVVDREEIFDRVFGELLYREIGAEGETGN